MEINIASWVYGIIFRIIKKCSSLEHIIFVQTSSLLCNYFSIIQVHRLKIIMFISKEKGKSIFNFLHKLEGNIFYEANIYSNFPADVYQFIYIEFTEFQ